MFIFGYLVIGILYIYGRIICHVIAGEIAGYEIIKYWTSKSVQKHIDSMFDTYEGIFRFITGLFMWPIRAIEAEKLMKHLYENVYEKKI